MNDKTGKQILHEKVITFLINQPLVASPYLFSHLHKLNRSLTGFLPTRKELVHQCMETGIVAGFQKMAQLMNYDMLDAPFGQQQQI